MGRCGECDAESVAGLWPNRVAEDPAVALKRDGGFAAEREMPGELSANGSFDAARGGAGQGGFAETGSGGPCQRPLRRYAATEFQQSHGSNGQHGQRRRLPQYPADAANRRLARHRANRDGGGGAHPSRLITRG